MSFRRLSLVATRFASKRKVFPIPPPGEELVVARRLREVLEKAKKTARSRPQRSEAELAALRQDNRSTSGTRTPTA
jgi:hypothetical protein